MIQLWPHPQQSIDLLRKALASGKRKPMLQVPTGGGKTRTAGAIVELMRQRDKRAVFIVDAISLIDQTVQSFYDLGLSDIGVIQADHAMTDWSKPIQVASVQTLQRRGMRSEEHTSELQSLMRISYAVFCLKKKTKKTYKTKPETILKLQHNCLNSYTA